MNLIVQTVWYKIHHQNFWYNTVLSETGSIALYRSAFGPGASDQPIYFNDMVCTGSEAGPQACTSSMNLIGCSHSEDASVICPPLPGKVVDFLMSMSSHTSIHVQYAHFFIVPEAPEKLQIQLNSLECSAVSFSWRSPKNLLFQSAYQQTICFCFHNFFLSS